MTLLLSFSAVFIMTVVVSLSAFLRLISLLRLSEPIAFLSFAEILSKERGKLLKQVQALFLPGNVLA